MRVGERRTVREARSEGRAREEVRKGGVTVRIMTGKKISESEEIQMANWVLSKVNSLEYISEDVGSLVEDVVQTWIRAIPEFVQQVEELSQQLRFESSKSSMNSIVDMIENCESLVDSLIPIRSLMGTSIAAV